MSESPENRRQLFDRLEGLMLPEDVAIALGISKATLRDLDIPHVRLTRSSSVYFPDEIVTWLRAHPRHGHATTLSQDAYNDLVEVINGHQHASVQS